MDEHRYFFSCRLFQYPLLYLAFFDWNILLVKKPTGISGRQKQRNQTTRSNDKMQALNVKETERRKTTVTNHGHFFYQLCLKQLDKNFFRRRLFRGIAADVLLKLTIFNTASLVSTLVRCCEKFRSDYSVIPIEHLQKRTKLQKKKKEKKSEEEREKRETVSARSYEFPSCISTRTSELVMEAPGK